MFDCGSLADQMRVKCGSVRINLRFMCIGLCLADDLTTMDGVFSS